ncbi:MAG: 2-isopropylmalate synthase [Melioribacteraceae bacterium]|nr:2-isopropylmalate synthase [Melioribacteraceae bacterium]MCF8265227.1 2-isopropylmalate synthase [Melioribacteraceae bacterium]MCF8413042.1 2-isopropylmalate synthase [Melioribacteraceae bacterium]
MLKILDTTLREGEQTPGVYFDLHIKSAIADLLDEIGVDIIEVGHPAVTEEIRLAVSSIAKRGLNARVGAHSRTTLNDVELALDCGVGFLGIFYCVSNDRLNGVFKKELSHAIGQIQEMITLIKSKNSDIIVRYTPEDTVRSKYENVFSAASAAVEAGADVISIADTTGFMIPGTSHNMYDHVKRLKADLAEKNLFPMIAVHCHNDRGLALANALDAYRGGAEIIDASVIGLGERAGIVDLAQLLVTLSSGFGFENRWDLKKLVELYDLVSKHSGVTISKNFPIIGENAFTHCAGVHTHAAAINPMHYESLDPALVGRERTFALDHMSGIASVKYALELIGIFNPDKETIQEVLFEVKKVGQKGRLVDLTELPHIVKSIKHIKSTAVK